MPSVRFRSYHPLDAFSVNLRLSKSVDKAKSVHNEPLKPTPFERFVQRIAGVPKSAVDALEAAERAKPRVKPGPKPRDRKSA